MEVTIRYFMGDTEIIYHIYYGQQCVYPSLKEEDFNRCWEFANAFADLTELDQSLLSYEKCRVVRELILSDASY